MADIEFRNFGPEVKAEMRAAAVAWLEEAASEVQSQAERNTRVATGRTKGSFQHKVDGPSLTAVIGSDYENAIWEEFGTGVYAEEGGRTDVPWTYQAEDGKWYKTKGKRGTKALRNAFTTSKPKLLRAAQKAFGKLD